jgi:hypothetical protein
VPPEVTTGRVVVVRGEVVVVVGCEAIVLDEVDPEDAPGSGCDVGAVEAGNVVEVLGAEVVGA